MKTRRKVFLGQIWLGLLATALLVAQYHDTRAFGVGHRFRLEYSKKYPGTQAIGIVERSGHAVRHYPLPQSTFKTYATLWKMPLQYPPLSAKN